jgi:hypothetical protein
MYMRSSCHRARPRREAINQALLEVLESDQWPVTLRYFLGPQE